MSRGKISEKEIQALLQLDGPGRYDHFIKQVAAWEEAWGLYDAGWALGGDDSGMTTFQLWPAKDYAELCIEGDWATYEAAAIPLDDLVDELLPKLKKDGIGLGVFRTPAGLSVRPTVDQMLSDLRTEMSRYE